jgi:glutamine amidotransferase
MIGIVDYGVGNLFSVDRALARSFSRRIVARDWRALENCSALLLPGVGAFPVAVDRLRSLHLFEFVKEWAAAGGTLVGICLGMQILFTRGLEFGESAGLGILDGSVNPLSPLESSTSGRCKIPHIGWRNLENMSLPEGLVNAEDEFYFIHSFLAVPQSVDIVRATVTYGVNKIPAVVNQGSVWGFQFHPEKSREVGLKLLNYALTSGDKATDLSRSNTANGKLTSTFGQETD